MTLNLATHSIPLWFLVLSLFLPRICILVAWLQHGMGHYIPATVTLLDIVVAVLVPRLLILFWIYTDQGITILFVLHVIALLCAWGGGGNRISRRNRYRDRYAD